MAGFFSLTQLASRSVSSRCPSGVISYLPSRTTSHPDLTNCRAWCSLQREWLPPGWKSASSRAIRWPYSCAWRNALSKCAGGFSITNEVQAATHVPACHQKTSITRFFAGCCRFFTLTQCFCRPLRYGRSRCFETNPSNPNSHALRNRSGPISPSSNVATKMPSGLRANSRCSLVFRIKSRRSRKSSPTIASRSKALSSTFVLA